MIGLLPVYYLVIYFFYFFAHKHCDVFRYPQRLGWQLKITRKDIRSSEAYYRLHNFLISETGNGNISRQETVSMIPPLLLDVKPSDKVRNILFIYILIL